VEWSFLKRQPNSLSLHLVQKSPVRPSGGGIYPHKEHDRPNGAIVQASLRRAATLRFQCLLKAAAFRRPEPATERFTPVSAEEIEYKFAIDDPSTWTKPWSAIVPLSAYKGPLFEYDCSENNNDAVNILAGARRTEREAKGASGTPISQKSK
jgi:hypothetical protein